MNKADLIDAVAGDVTNAGLSKTSINWVVETAFAKVTEQLKQGNEVTLHGLGKLKVSLRKARTGRNPATGESISIAAKRSVVFTAAKQLKDAVNG